MNALTKTNINKFIALYTQAGESLLEASRVLVTLVSNDPDAFEHIIESCPDITYGTLWSLYKCGKIGLDPRKMLSNPTTSRAIFSLPERTATQVVKEGIPVLDPNSSKSNQLVLKPIDKVKTCEVRLAIHNGQLRNAKEQVEAFTKSYEVEVLRYTISDDGVVTFHQKTSWTVGQLSEILNLAMKKAVSSLSKLGNKVKA